MNKSNSQTNGRTYILRYNYRDAMLTTIIKLLCFADFTYYRNNHKIARILDNQ